jgi:hypothetical protein
MMHRLRTAAAGCSFVPTPITIETDLVGIMRNDELRVTPMADASTRKIIVFVQEQARSHEFRDRVERWSPTAHRLFVQKSDEERGERADGRGSQAVKGQSEGWLLLRGALDLSFEF